MQAIRNFVSRDTAINEKVYGNMATVFHRTSVSDLVNRVYTSGFKPGGGDMYGKGFYSTYELSSQERGNMAHTYGNIVVKFAVPVEKFLFFDFEPFKETPLGRSMQDATPQNFIQLQMDHYGFAKNTRTYYEMSRYRGAQGKPTSNLVLHFLKEYNLKSLVSGVVFTGSRDGHVLVAYDTSLIIPLSYRVDGEKEFQKVERNMDYLKQWAAHKADPGEGMYLDSLADKLRAIADGVSEESYSDYSDQIFGVTISGNDLIYEVNDSKAFESSDDQRILDAFFFGDEFYEVYLDGYGIDDDSLWYEVTRWFNKGAEGKDLRARVEKSMLEENPDADLEEMEDWNGSEVEMEYPETFQALQLGYSSALEWDMEANFHNTLLNDFENAISELGEVVQDDGYKVKLDRETILRAIEYSEDENYAEGEDNDFVEIGESIEETAELELNTDWDYYEPYGEVDLDGFLEALDL